MPAAYRQKIVEAFRDNAIKSVLLIDDHYLPYEGLADHFIKLNEELNAISNTESETFETKLLIAQSFIDSASLSFMSSDIAKGFVEFFHDKKLICDVENQTNNLDKDKVRKSDLIILDYYLEDEKSSANPAQRSLQLISELSYSKHMNMVVVYTAEPLGNVWNEIASTLRGTFNQSASNFFNEGELQRLWNKNSDDWKTEWALIDDATINADFLTSEHEPTNLLNKLKEACIEHDYEMPTEQHVTWLLEKQAQGFNKNNVDTTNRQVHGERGLWLQSGDIFVVLCEKERVSKANDTKRDVTPDEVWQQIQIALESWYPSFYRVVTSELQNQIEDINLSMEKVLAKGNVEQIAALWGVLRIEPNQRDQAARELLNTLLSDVADSVKANDKLLNFVETTANSVDENLPAFVSSDEDQTRHKNYLKDIVQPAYNNCSNDDNPVDEALRCQVLHAFNEQLSTEKELPNYISTGVILKDTNDSSYYLCISPSCDTVPKQATTIVANKMAPHRPMRFIKLLNETEKLVRKLKLAHQSDTIFISDGEERLALYLFEKGVTPTIEQGVVVKHNTKLIENKASKSVQFIATDEQTKNLKLITKDLVLIAKLRPAFTSRYQNAQLQYEARIGVDLVSADMK